MELEARVEATHEGEPATIDVKLKFDKGEYLTIVKELPYILNQIRLLSKQNKTRKA